MPYIHRPIIRFFSARPRLFLSILFGLIVGIFLPHWIALHDRTRFIIAWDAGIGLYLVLAMRMIFFSTHEKMKVRARLEDEGKFVILFLVVTAAVVSLAAIILELTVVRDMHGVIKYQHIALAAFTIIVSWAFTHTMFALHYAHDYYQRILKETSGGLDFPGKDLPDYSDFLYFAYIIGTSGQTADVSLSSRATRRIGTIHCVLAFFFNTTVLALTINIASGLF